MAGTYLEPSISLTSPDSISIQSVGAYNQNRPETSFESALTEAQGTVGALSFLSADGLAFANAENPTFGGTVVSTAISNLGANGAPGSFGATSGSGFASPGFSGGVGGTLPGVLGTNPAFNPSFSNGIGGNTTDGFNSGGVKQQLLDEGLQQILLMVEVQQASRTLDTMSNILKVKHDTDMNAIRNIKS